MSGVRLTVLGCAGTHPGPARLCSSYLVTYRGTTLLLDCGNGSLANLQRSCAVADVDAVLISHLHPDHFVDLYGLYYALRFHPDGARQVPVYAPQGAGAFVAQLLGDDDMFAETCRFTTVAAGDVVDVGRLSVRLYPARHPVETLAARVEAGGRVIAYSADSAPTPALVDCARDADLFLADCSWLERQRPLPEGIHMTAHEAATHAADAGASTLIVTHVSGANDPAEAAAEAAAAFDGTVVAAADLQRHELAPLEPAS